MSVISGLSRADFKTASDGLLELSEERLRSLMRKEPITDVYHVEQTPFARGKFASVRKIRHLVSGEEYAAKFIRKRRRAADTSREIRHEVAVLALCDGCTRVVRLHEVYDTGVEVAIVLELCAGGELQRLLDEEERLTEGAARRALRHVLEGLSHLHARRIAHLDLKPQNLLLSADGEELLICDFGISRAIQSGAHVREILGTRDYVAPEILSYEPLSLAADIWSVGVLAYVLLSGYSPFAGDTKQETYLNIAQCQLSFPRELFRGVSPGAVQFIQETLVVDPNGRLTVEECLAHPWLKDDSDIPRAIVGVGFQSAASEDDDETRLELNGHTDVTRLDINGHTDVTRLDINGHSDVNGDINGHTNGTNGGKQNGTCTDKHNGIEEQNGRNEKLNGDHEDTKHNGHGDQSNGFVNGDKVNGCLNGDYHNGTCYIEEKLNGDGDYVNGETNGVNGHSGINGHNGVNRCTNGTHDDECRPTSPYEDSKPLKHAHARDVEPAFPDAPSTPKVSRKSHPHPPSVLALCKKFQPDYEKPAKLGDHAHHAHHARHAHPPADCGCGPPPRRAVPDRAVLC